MALSGCCFMWLGRTESGGAPPFSPCGLIRWVISVCVVGGSVFPPGVWVTAVSYSPTPWRVQYHRRWRA